MEGQVKCRYCYGKKFIHQYVNFLGNVEHRFVKCPNCAGLGSMSWIDEIMGRNKKRRKRQWKKPRGRKK